MTTSILVPMNVDLAQIDQRLAAVEAALTQVQQSLGLAPAPANWVEQVSGSMADIPEEDYQEFLRYCRTSATGTPGNVVHDIRCRSHRPFSLGV